MTRSDARKRIAQCADIRATPEYADIRTLPAPYITTRAGLAAALHARIDGDWLIGGGGWGPDGWADDIQAAGAAAALDEVAGFLSKYDTHMKDWLRRRARQVRDSATGGGA